MTPATPIKGNIKNVLKAPTKPITNFASLQHLLPLYASDKEDGIRCIIHPVHGPCSQKMLPIANDYIRQVLEDYSPNFLDGELVTFTDADQQHSFNDVQSAVMSQAGVPNWRYLVFDCFENTYAPFTERLQRAKDRIDALNDEYRSPDPGIVLLPQTLCHTIAEIQECERDAIARGKEGIMLRHPRGWYKEGRSTEREGYMLKVKRFTDDEAVVEGLEEQQMNCNAATKDANGKTKRSHHQANKIGKGCVGNLVCRWHGLVIRLDGLNEAQRYLWWARPELIIGKTVTFRYQPHGMQTLPRAPKFKGIRLDA